MQDEGHHVKHSSLNMLHSFHSHKVCAAPETVEQRKLRKWKALVFTRRAGFHFYFGKLYNNENGVQGATIWLQR